MVFPKDWQIQVVWGSGWVGLVQVGVFWVYKDLSQSYREGIDEKLKYKQKQYKMKGLKNMYQNLPGIQNYTVQNYTGSCFSKLYREAFDASFSHIIFAHHPHIILYMYHVIQISSYIHENISKRFSQQLPRINDRNISRGLEHCTAHHLHIILCMHEPANISTHP